MSDASEFLCPRCNAPLKEVRTSGGVLYGCDVCQDVCPWNGKALVATDRALAPRFRTGTLDLREVLGWTPEEYRSRLRGSAMKRVKLPVLQRNARVVAGNLAS